MNEERYSTWDSFPPKKFFFKKTLFYSIRNCLS